VTISLEQSSYVVSEADGLVEVCAVLTDNLIAPGIEAVVTLATQGGSAGQGLEP